MVLARHAKLKKVLDFFLEPKKKVLQIVRKSRTIKGSGSSLKPCIVHSDTFS
jgi:hypothetical protein